MSTNEPTWECVNATDYTDTYRLAVPGGWLYRVERRVDGDLRGTYKVFAVMTVTFVPTPLTADDVAAIGFCVCGHGLHVHGPRGCEFHNCGCKRKT